ncbi:hypothetical protein K504DRAFT_238192 [Pleomassaria siparia CBS 279.74]|uniref:Transmembrane protein n=1 Tax=Pleomassaria siparia CBS 279.74 TaxID=1314801 RepID=A0A6G1KEK1_9PLEO|nr:hypothetical protein K504DRAFT_238192 [Pleomassaria siparia CBS 279.74]
MSCCRRERIKPRPVPSRPVPLRKRTVRLAAIRSNLYVLVAVLIRRRRALQGLCPTMDDARIRQQQFVSCIGWWVCALRVCGLVLGVLNVWIYLNIGGGRVGKIHK